LKSVQIGKYKEGPFIAAICDECAKNGAEGLLGLNFTSRFHMVIDNNKAEIRLDKPKKWIDSKAEIEFFLDLSHIKA
jgi:hypothetical protein